MLRVVPIIFAWLFALAAATVAMGGEVDDKVRILPYRVSIPLEGAVNTSNARVIVPARLHPEVEVSRSLAAQPVHPWMVKVVLGGETINRWGSTSPVISTWIDPARKLDGSGGLDENHSLVRAQRLHRSLTDSGDELTQQRIRGRQWRTEQIAAGNKARIVVNPDPADADDHTQATPIMIIPIPEGDGPDAAPTHDADDKLIAEGPADAAGDAIRPTATD